MPSPSPGGITAEDLVALRVYLRRDHAKIDQALRALDMPALQALNAHIRLASHGLSLLPDHRGPVRLAAALPAGLLARYVPGAVLREHGFVCATAAPSLQLGGNTCFVVRPVNARRVGALADQPGELTVVFFTGSRFEVLAIDPPDDAAATAPARVYLRELPDPRLLKSPPPAPGDPLAELAALRAAWQAHAGTPDSARVAPHDASLYQRRIGFDDAGQPFPQQ